MRRFLLVILAGFWLFVWNGRVFAWPNYYDYSDAPSPYGEASSGGGSPYWSWQWFGQWWGADSGPMYNNEDLSDNGIWWSTDGSNFGHPAVVPGQTVWLKFEANELGWNWWKEYVKIWIDWNKDGTWNNTDELVWEYIWNDTYTGGNLESTTQIKEITVPTYASLGRTWLRARITCEWNAAMGPTGRINQGEVEDYPFDVTPEPATFLLVSVGLVGLGAARFKKREKDIYD